MAADGSQRALIERVLEFLSDLLGRLPALFAKRPVGLAHGG
jgi:hypothetical protein